MKLLVMYDISDDNKRQLVAKTLRIHGLSRIQRSVFVGPGSLALARDVVRAIKKIINPITDIVHIVLVQDIEWRKRFVLGRGEVDESKTTVLII